MSKVRSRHLERKACVYVRQSSLMQVRDHREGGVRQYNLRDRALALGWPADRVEVIDEDQGQSGASAQKRAGFQGMVAAVGLGEVGAVLGLEASRLARSCADWYRLLEIATLAGALIIDEDGVYDPKLPNDRLLLGLKGNLSEAELYFIKQRMVGGRRSKASRGEYRIRLPAGYVWEKDHGIRLDPDEQVREAVKLLFGTFERLGTAGRVARYFGQTRQPFPRRDGFGNLDVAVSWGPLRISRVVEVLKNPVYAGFYAYNRYAAGDADEDDPAPSRRILIPGAHPSYVTPEQYEPNVARLMANRNLHEGARCRGTAREGASLVQGIAMCGRCGRMMSVTYQRDRSVRYGCRDSRTNTICQDVHGRYVDRLVEAQILESLTAENLELAVAALERLSERATELDRQWQRRIEAARYEAERASRRYHQVEPENRLVARTLESEWNRRLEELETVEKEYAEIKKRPPFELSERERQRVLALAKDLPALWHAPTTRASQRKEIVRLLIEDVTLLSTAVRIRRFPANSAG